MKLRMLLLGLAVASMVPSPSQGSQQLFSVTNEAPNIVIEIKSKNPQSQLAELLTIDAVLSARNAEADKEYEKTIGLNKGGRVFRKYVIPGVIEAIVTNIEDPNVVLIAIYSKSDAITEDEKEILEQFQSLFGTALSVRRCNGC